MAFGDDYRFDKLRSVGTLSKSCEHSGKRGSPLHWVLRAFAGSVRICSFIDIADDVPSTIAGFRLFGPRSADKELWNGKSSKAIARQNLRPNFCTTLALLTNSTRRRMFWTAFTKLQIRLVSSVSSARFCFLLDGVIGTELKKGRLFFYTGACPRSGGTSTSK